MLIAIAIVAMQATGAMGLGSSGNLGLCGTGSVTSITSSLFLIGLILGAAIFATNVGVGLWKLRRWAHTPALMLQLLGAAIGTASFSGEFAEPLDWYFTTSGLMRLWDLCCLFGGGIRSLFHSCY